MRVIMVKVGKKPLIEEINEDRKTVKKFVGGLFTIQRPYKEQGIAVVCNVAGSTAGAPMNRWIVDENGKSKFVVYGDFLICKVDEGNRLCGFTAKEAMGWKRFLER